MHVYAKFNVKFILLTLNDCILKLNFCVFSSNLFLYLLFYTETAKSKLFYTYLYDLYHQAQLIFLLK